MEYSNGGVGLPEVTFISGSTFCHEVVGEKALAVVNTFHDHLRAVLEHIGHYLVITDGQLLLLLEKDKC